MKCTVCQQDTIGILGAEYCPAEFDLLTLAKASETLLLELPLNKAAIDKHLSNYPKIQELANILSSVGETNEQR